LQITCRHMHLEIIKKQTIIRSFRVKVVP
jgi:hypothetical protein